jgi:outer membrane protein assembly factor BamB
MKIRQQLLISLLFLSAANAQSELKFHAAPKPLADDAVTADWPRFLGPTDDLHSPETHLLKQWPDSGPAIVWEVARGAGQAAPSIANGRLIHIQLREGKEIVECREAETGKPIWNFEYAVQAASSYGTPDAPRCSPVIDVESGLVFVLGLRSDLHCLSLESGEVVWKKNLDSDFGAAPFFFARGSCPLVFGENLIVNVGSKPCVAALNKKTGELVWGVDHAWNSSYASPVPAKIHGQDRVLVFAGGMTDPPHGGLLSLDPATGKIDGAFAWRARMFASVFITEGYTEGGAMVGFSEDFKMSSSWTAPRFASQFATPVAHDGHLYGFSGSSESGAELVCLEAKSGREIWRDGMNLEAGGRRVLLGRASLIHADGSFFCLGEQGTLVCLDLTPEGPKALSVTQLFYAPETWGAPALSGGLLYVLQNGRESRLICFDLRKPAS